MFFDDGAKFVELSSIVPSKDSPESTAKVEVVQEEWEKNIKQETARAPKNPKKSRSRGNPRPRRGAPTSSPSVFSEDERREEDTARMLSIETHARETLESEMAVLREKLRKAEKAKLDAKSDTSGKQASEPKTSSAESRLIRSQAEQDAATAEAMRHRQAQNLKRLGTGAIARRDHLYLRDKESENERNCARARRTSLQLQDEWH